MSESSRKDFGNPFLTQVMRAIRKNRPNLKHADHLVIHEKILWGKGAEIWFRTGGCSWDGCTMCEYGKGNPTTAQEMVTSVKRAIQKLERSNLIALEIFPSGSMLDPREVPPSARAEIFQELARLPVPILSIESRAETVTHEVLQEIKDTFSYRQIMGIHIGLETSNPWILRYCVNKGSHPSLFEKAASRAQHYLISTLANISVGHAFLSPLETLEDSVQSVRWALENGAQRVNLFALSVRPHTLLNLLYQNERYAPVSLWVLPEILFRLGPESASKVMLSLYRNDFGDPMIQLPTSCELCESDVLLMMDQYKASRDFNIIQKLYNHPCECHQRWRDSLKIPEIPLADRLIENYDFLAKELKLERYWNKRRETMIKEIRSSAPVFDVTTEKADQLS